MRASAQRPLLHNSWSFVSLYNLTFITTSLILAKVRQTEHYFVNHAYRLEKRMLLHCLLAWLQNSFLACRTMTCFSNSPLPQCLMPKTCFGTSLQQELRKIKRKAMQCSGENAPVNFSKTSNSSCLSDSCCFDDLKNRLAAGGCLMELQTNYWFIIFLKIVKSRFLQLVINVLMSWPLWENYLIVSCF